MQISVSDIHAAKDFAKALEGACTEILNGRPRSAALGKAGISVSVFNTLVKGLKRTSVITPEEVNELRHPAWEDDLAYDLTGEENFFIPDDFSEALSDVSERVLDPEERETIRLLYPGRMSYEEAAKAWGVSEMTLRKRKREALRKLKPYANEFLEGSDFEKRLKELKSGQRQHYRALSWMGDAAYFLDREGSEENQPVSDQPVSPEAEAFYRRNGLETLSDVVNYSLSDIFTCISDEMQDRGAFLQAVRQTDDFSLDSVLDESAGIDSRAADAFENAWITTVRDFLALSRDSAFSIKGVGPKTVVYIYRRVLFG